MLKNFDLVVYLGCDWLGYHRRQMLLALAQRMERVGQILCVERPVCPVTTPLHYPRKFREWAAGKRGIRREATNLFVYTPYVLIHDQVASCLPGITTANRALLSHSLKKVLPRLHFKAKVRLSWLYNPFQVDYTGLVNEDGFVYECLDNYSELCHSPLITKQGIERREITLLKTAKIVFTTAQPLYDIKRAININTFYTPNAVDLEVFQRCWDGNWCIPDDLEVVPPPRFGFVGNLDNGFVDCDLLEEIARSNPHWSFVFLGPVTKSEATDRLRSLPNVHCLGYRKYEYLPMYLCAFDAGLIPFRINQITLSLNPLKLYEYMAAGCPIVSTDVPEVSQYAPLVKIAKNSNEFFAALQSVLHSGCSELRKALRNEAKRHSWDNRVEQIVRIIKRYAT